MKMSPIFIILVSFFTTAHAYGLVNPESAITKKFNLSEVSDEEKVSIIRSYLVKYFPDEYTEILFSRLCEINSQLRDPIPLLAQQCWEQTGLLSDQEKVDLIRVHLITPNSRRNNDQETF